MAQRLPYSRIVDVSLTRIERFATATGFSVTLLVTPDEVAGEVDATKRTKVYGDLLEIAVDYPSSTDTYQSAAALFAQTPRPRQMKIGYRNPANSITDELNAIYAYDPDWYWVGHTVELRDTADQRAFADWAETKSVLAGLDSSDVDTETPAASADSSASVTITIAAPGVFTWTAHGLAADAPVRFTTTGALPTGIVPGVTYYISASTTNGFSVAATPGGAAITTSGTQSGVHTGSALRYGGSLAEYVESKGYDRSFVFYTLTATEFPAMALFGYLATRDLDRGTLRAAVRGDIASGNAYTAKFKKLAGITALNKGSAAVQAISGFIPGIGIDASQGHRANAYVNIGGLDMVVEGSVGSGAFIDEIHAGDWIVARTREALLSALATNARIPYTNRGTAILTNAIDSVMRRAVASGVVAGDFAEDGNEFTPDYSMEVDRVENIPVSQRRNRIAPDIKVDFRYAGAFHYVSSSITLRF